MNIDYHSYTTGEKLNNQLSIYQCGWQRCKKGHAFGPAIRDHYLIHFIVDGEGTYVANGEKYFLKKGDGFLILPSESTYYKASNDKPWEYYWVGFHGTEVKNLLNHLGLGEQNLLFSYNKDEKITEYLNGLFMASKISVSAEYAMLGYLYLFFSCLMKETPNNRVRKFNYETHLEKTLKYIKGNFSRDMRISELADFIGINRSHLSRIFKSQLYISPENFLINYRLAKAKELLRDSNLNVSQVAYSTGFKDPSHFSKQFKKNCGVTPLQYKKDPF